MKISKLLSTVCLAAFCASFLSVHAQDNAAQAAARAALLEKMGIQAPPPAQPATNAVSPPVETNAAAPKAETAPAKPATAPSIAPTPSNPEAEATARAALLQAMGLNPAEKPAPAAVPAPSAPMAGQPAPAPVAVAPKSPSVQTTAKPVKPAAKPATPAPVAAKSMNATVAGKEAGFTPIVAPPLPISMTKEQQLDALLAKYKADQITPEEYHKQRAAILAQP